MLEEYFVKPRTVDRIRGSWIGPQIEQYVTWLAGQGYGTRCVLRRVPLVTAFGEFAAANGARQLADLPEHVSAFVSMRVSQSRDARRAQGDTLAKDIRGPVEQMLTIVLPGYSGSGRPRRPVPFGESVPGFFEYLVSERGLRPASVESTCITCAGSRPASPGSGSPGSRNCRRRCSALLSPSGPGWAWRRRRCGRAAGCCACSCATPTARA